MSGNATIYFLPWLRRGVSASIISKDNQSTGGHHAGFEVTLGFNAQAGGGPSIKESATISLYGPGEVTGLDHQVIIRTLPKPDVTDFEANLFPMIEFDQPDLPWRYTPASASREDRLKPWICLIVLREDEIERLDPAGPDRLLPAVTVKDASNLPDLDQSGAWAHIHVSGYDVGKDKEEDKEKTDDSKVADILANHFHSAVSRLLCPRRLDNLTRYTAFLVPTFERGRLSGLGLPLDDKVDSLEKAWAGNDRLIQLPVYYTWNFKTGPLGDFEYLASILEPYELGAEVGTRKMNVAKPGLGLPPASGGPLEMDGALDSAIAPDSAWMDGTQFIEKLVNILNLPGKYLKVEAPKSIVTPPLYGQTYANRDGLPYSFVPANNPPKLPEPPSSFDRKWFWKININPCRRVASGLGTRVIQSNQQQLMASAWDQVEAIRKANREIRFNQLSMEVSSSSYKRNINSRGTDASLYQTEPLHNRVGVQVASNASNASNSKLMIQPPIQYIVKTAGSRLRESPIPIGVLQSQWRRKASLLGALGRRQGRRDLTGEKDSLKRMAAGKLKASESPRPSTSTVSFSKLELHIIEIARVGRETEAGGTVIDSDAEILSALKEVRDALTFEPKEFEVLTGFKINDKDDKTPDELDTFKDQIVVDLEPRKNIAGGFNKRLTLTEDLLPQAVVVEPKALSTKDLAGEDSLEPIMRAPEFPKPTYNYLKEISEEWLLPGVEKVPPNSISLLKANQPFIEAFMVGLNHEMGRELLWNGYPTDRRGTYFRQFWDSSGVVSSGPEPPDPEDVMDIKLLNDWKTGDLGDNSARKLKVKKENLVLLIRGELLKRYPNTMIYAAKAVWSGSSKEIDLTVEEHPIFSGTLRPDISFFGFNLTKEQALGVMGDAGWFFILQEQPSEPRFGLDVALSFGQKVKCWQNISWGHLVNSSEDLNGLVYINLNSPWPDLDLNSLDDSQEAEDCRNNKPKDAQDDAKFKWKDGGSSDLAYITYQPPVRIAIHAERMLKDL
jgi:hypothetical protein